MFDKKQSKSSLSNAFMVSAIAFVLVMGTGYSSMHSFGLDYNGLGDTDLLNGFTQSAECAGLGNDCSEDNLVNIPPEPIRPSPPTPEPTECELCLAELTDEHEAVLFAALDVESIAEACLLVGIDRVALYNILVSEELPFYVILDIFACLGLEIPTPVTPP